VAIMRYDLHSRSLPGKAEALFFGGLGHVTYTTLAYDRYAMCLLHTLADLRVSRGWERASAWTGTMSEL